MITVDDEQIYALYNEGQLSDLAKVGAIAGASLFGTPNTTMGDTTYKHEYSSENMNVLNAETFLDLWIKYYQTDGSVEGKEKSAKDKVKSAALKLSDGVDIPSNAMNAINNAVSIFGGDEGVSPNVLSDLLVYTGEVESLYKTRKQYGDGPARGYWQVEPKTAIDLLINSKSYFGPKFRKMFGEDLFKITKDTEYNRKYLAKRLMNDNLAAAFAAAKWVSVSKRAGLKNIKNN